MVPEIKLSRSVDAQLEKLTAGQSALESSYGRLFVSAEVPVACIRLKVPREDYLTFLENLPKSDRAPSFKVVPVEGSVYDIAIIGTVVVEDGVVKIDGEKVIIL